MLLPLTLGILTAGYNFARFGSFFDFGYARIPGVLREPWYQHGLFSLHAIPWNVHKMLFEGFGDRPTFPYLRLYPFGCSIFLSSPFLFLIFREGGRQTGMLACYRSAHVHPLDPWESGRLAILLPLRDYPAPVDVPVVSWQRPSEDICNRSFTFCCFGRNQRDRYVAISLD
jgi:hypothetical protein